jgi:transposase
MQTRLATVPGDQREGIYRNGKTGVSIPSLSSRAIATCSRASLSAPQTPVQAFSAHEAVWLFVRHADDLSEAEQETLATILSQCETARTIYQLVQDFRQILHLREGEKLNGWLERVRASQIRPLQSFVGGIERDKAAVLAGLTRPQNNGLVEGKVNKLKLIKRMMFGRAEFPLLRQRVLHAF